jgi:hypothetical protein
MFIQSRLVETRELMTATARTAEKTRVTNRIW